MSEKENRIRFQGRLARGLAAVAWSVWGLALLACNSSDARRGSAEAQARVEREMKAMISAQLLEWERASRDLADAAPLPADRGWSASEDAEAIERMKQAWHRAREAYELIEGAIAPTFPESDAATDARYDDFLQQIGPVGDRTPFDDQGVVGMHAIERILWADSTPPVVIAFERGLPGYQPAYMPRTAQEAAAFKTRLAERLVRDIQALRRQFEPLVLDVAFAFQGLIDLAAEQAEKVDRASTGQEESRYARSTMRDLRANRRGCQAAYAIFRPWVLSKPGGEALDREVLAAFERLERAYAAVPGDAIPEPPRGWSGVSPKPEHADTPFGRLFHLVRKESDELADDSLSGRLYAIAEHLGLRDVVARRPAPEVP